MESQLLPPTVALTKASGLGSWSVSWWETEARCALYQTPASRTSPWPCKLTFLVSSPRPATLTAELRILTLGRCPLKAQEGGPWGKKGRGGDLGGTKLLPLGTTW